MPEPCRSAVSFHKRLNLKEFAVKNGGENQRMNVVLVCFHPVKEFDQKSGDKLCGRRAEIKVILMDDVDFVLAVPGGGAGKCGGGKVMELP